MFLRGNSLQLRSLIVSLVLLTASFSMVAQSERTVTQLAAGVYEIQHRSSSGNTTVIIGERQVLVVDTCYLPSEAREDIAQIKIPTLVIHGDADQILPIDATGKRTAALIPGAEYHVVEGGPHGLNWTHATEVNKVLLEFIAK